VADPPAAVPAYPDRLPPVIDPSVPHSARVYDYLLGGVDNFAVDREQALRQVEAVGGTIEDSRADIRKNRAFLGRSVRYLASERGIRQFLDLGTGIPNADNVHAVAQEAAADARIVYVDNDPIVLAHAHSLLRSTSEGQTAYVDADLREPKAVLRRSAATLDPAEPIAVMLVSILHHLPDEDDPHGVIAQYMDKLAPGSYLVVSHLAKDIRPEDMAALERSAPPDAAYTFHMRTRDEVTRFFDGLEIVEPGVVTPDEWRPESPSPDDRVAGFWCAVGRKP
jgi:SAM-dependent methyltransferase